MDFTLEDAFALVAANKNFYHERREVRGHHADLFNYRLPQEVHFDSDLALEMRGLCFLDGQRWLAQQKFFNINQVSTTRYEVLRDKPVAEVTDKLDGSLIRFLRVGEDVVAKSKMSFASEMAERANALFAGDAALRALVLHTLDAGLAAHFEYVSPQNLIVLAYQEERLVLHSVRSETTGEVIAASEFAHFGVPVAQSFSFEEGAPVLDDLLLRCETETDREGYVVRFTDGQMVKLKTAWYCELHGLCTENVNRAHSLVRFVLDDTVDDVLGQLPLSHSATRDRVLHAQTAVSQALLSAVGEIKSMVACYTGDRKAFALEFKERDWFKLAVKCIDATDEQIMEKVKDHYRKNTAKLSDAERLLARLLAEAGFADDARLLAEAGGHLQKKRRIAT
jgi:T4 RnlA family RNA ligase